MTESLAPDSSAATDSERIPDTAIPEAETPAARCPYCSQPFRTEQACTLHVGDTHREAWTDDERAAYETAVDDEADDLFVFHLKVVGALSLLYAGYVLAYMIVLGLQS
ncbi:MULTISPECIES: DUF7410 domain-containing protein [Halococcus]|uniref:C2H2-type domain-containing protein n=1 Tax=Halococcus salifodinae DSM 8989 TaxID=1227456 RepID=M0N062_9EURY|nr:MULTISPECIES: hypothetical protein [Halococcus]EMA50035.1 hypothetical protein C450_15835 [Halococcus salifodinae DSM 8989]